MKKIITLIAFVSVAVLAVSCKKDGPDQPVGEHQFKCTIELVDFGASSRIPTWKDADAIGVYSQLDTNVRCEIKDVAAGTFHDAGVQGKSDFMAVYPHNVKNEIKDSILTSAIPATQQLASGSPVAPNAIISVAKSANKELEFHNCIALFKLTIPRDDIKKVEIYSNSKDDKLTGEFTVDMRNDVDVTIVPEKCDSVITLLPAGGNFAPGSYYASFLPGTHNGINIKFTNLKDETIIVSKEDIITYRVNEGCSLGSFFYYEIATAEDFAQWANESKSKSPTPWDVVTIMSNIDMTGIECSEVENFTGLFTARKNATENFRISGLTKPLFNKFYGKCDGVDLESNIVYDGSYGQNYGCGMFSHYNYTGKREDVSIANVNTYGTIECKFTASLNHQFNLGGISGATNGVPISNCTNNATILFTNLVLTNNYATIGGIVGAAQSAVTATVTDCKNYGTITIQNTNEVGKTLACGGIVGYSTQAIVFTNLENYGSITMTPESKQKGNRILGGILAEASVGVAIQNCKNDAPITLTPGSDDTGSSSAAGGILGYAAGKGESVIIDGCTNTAKGTILVSGGSSYSCPSGIVGWSVSNMNVTGCTNNADITFKGTNANDLRMGGIIGNCANDSKVTKSLIGSAQSGCYNTGKITNEGGASKNAYVGGILGCSGSKSTDVVNCHNTGDIINNTTAAMSTSLCLGGITGYSGTAACAYEDCTCKCEIVKKDACSHKAVYAGTIHGNANTTINAQHNGLGGSVLGVALTSENFLSKYYGKKTTYNIDADEQKEKSYFIQ